MDTAYTVFDAGDEAQQTLISMLERKLKDAGVDYNNLGTVSIPAVLAESKVAQDVLLGLKQQYEASSALAAEIDLLKADNSKRPPQDVVDRLKADLAVAKAALDALHPALKPEGFWGYVQGRTARKLMQQSDTDQAYRCRLVVSAKAQTIQVVEKRTWRADKIFGRSDIQVEYRLLEPSGKQKNSGITLATFSAGKETKTEPLFTFPGAASLAAAATDGGNR